jgi:hypothetical protein
MIGESPLPCGAAIRASGPRETTRHGRAAWSRRFAHSHSGRCDGERAMIKAPARGSRVRPFLARHVLVPGGALPARCSGSSGVRATAMACGALRRAGMEREWFCRELYGNKCTCLTRRRRADRQAGCRRSDWTLVTTCNAESYVALSIPWWVARGSVAGGMVHRRLEGPGLPEGMPNMATGRLASGAVAKGCLSWRSLLRFRSPETNVPEAFAGRFGGARGHHVLLGKVEARK